MEEGKMNKEKVFIEGYEVGFLVDTTGAREKKIQVASGEIVSIDERFIYKSIEREKVKIPQVVAEFIEFKKKNNFHVYGAMRTIEDHYDKRVPEWFYENNIETFALAWLDGYEVEETKYVVTDGNHLYFKGYQEDVDIVILADEQPGTMEYVKKFDTKEEAQKAADILGWKVQEVE
jgi:phage protein